MTPTREQILAASAGWVAVVLNLVPGLGSGYLYQRRWRAYWITSGLACVGNKNIGRVPFPHILRGNGRRTAHR